MPTNYFTVSYCRQKCILTQHVLLLRPEGALYNTGPWRLAVNPVRGLMQHINGWRLAASLVHNRPAALHCICVTSCYSRI